MWAHHQPDVSDHPEHDGDAPDGGVVVPPLLLGHQDDPEVGQDVRAQHLSVVYLSLLVFLRSECRNTQLCGQCQLVWRNSGNCDRMNYLDIHIQSICLTPISGWLCVQRGGRRVYL